MSSEISFTAKLIVDNGYYVNQSTDLTLNQTTQGYFAETITALNAVQVLTFGTLTTYGWAWFQNLDATDYIEVGRIEDPTYGTVFFPFMLLYPGEKCFMPLISGHLYGCRSETGTAILEYGVFDR